MTNITARWQHFVCSLLLGIHEDKWRSAGKSVVVCKCAARSVVAHQGVAYTQGELALVHLCMLNELLRVHRLASEAAILHCNALDWQQGQNLRGPTVHP